MFVWIGEKASPAECHNAMGYAHVSELLIMNTRFCLEFLFSSPEQRSGRAIVLSQALADANVKCFMSKFFGPHYFHGERGGSVVECRTPEREVRGSRPTSAVLCP